MTDMPEKNMPGKPHAPATDAADGAGKTGSIPPRARPPLPPASNTLKEISPAPAPGVEPDAPKLDPTRYGDWEKNGRCIDF